MKSPALKYIISTFICFCVGISIPMLIGSTSIHLEQPTSRSHGNDVIPPTIPEKLEFNGEMIDLRRYDRHERIDRELMAFMFMHSSTLQIIKKANRFFPIIEPILKQNGIPDDFKYLMAIESNLNVAARSPAGAAGLWQIMPQTAKELGLEVNDQIDERYHIEKSTRAACKYLKQAYAKYGDWMLVAASYNAGQARISSQLEKQQVDEAMDLFLVEETSRYMYRILAIKEIFKSPRKYGFLLKSEHLYPMIPYDTEMINTTIPDLVTYAKSKGVTYAQLKDANRWLRAQTLPNKSGRQYIINIPTKQGMNYDPKKIKPYNKHWVVD